MFAREKLDYSATDLPDRVKLSEQESLSAVQAHLAYM